MTVSLLIDYFPTWKKTRLVLLMVVYYQKKNVGCFYFCYHCLIVVVFVVVVINIIIIIIIIVILGGGGSVRTMWLDTGLRNLLVSGSWEPFLMEKIGWSVKLTTQPYQVPRFRIIGAVPPVPPMLSWKFVSYFTLHDRLFHAWVALNFVPKFHQVTEYKAEFFVCFLFLFFFLLWLLYNVLPGW